MLRPFGSREDFMKTIAVIIALAGSIIAISGNNAFASKMNGSYGCSEGMGRCHGNDTNRVFTTGTKTNTKKSTK
jgi:hypothetical protein